MKPRYLAALAGLALSAAAAYCQEAPRSPYAGPAAPPADPAVRPCEPSAPCELMIVDSQCGPGGPTQRAWFQADYLLWWVKDGPLPVPLAVTGSLADPFPGALDQPGTRVLFGGSGLRYDTASGLRLGGGYWLDADRRFSLEASGFLLDRRSVGFAAATDASGNPVLGQPFVNALTGNQNVYLVGFPEFPVITGSLADASHSRFSGWEVNVGKSVLRRGDFGLTALAGFRALRLDEDLQMASEFNTSRAAGLFLAPFSGTTFDEFRVGNRFYGGQVGGRLCWTHGAWSVDATAKVALGGTQQLAEIAGASQVNTNGVVTNTASGVYAGPVNSGSHFRCDFAVAPEAGANVAVRLCEHLSARVGYTFLYLSRVTRPGDLVDPTINPHGVPTDPTSFGLPGGPARPSFDWHQTDFWAHGVSFGLELRY